MTVTPGEHPRRGILGSVDAELTPAEKLRTAFDLFDAGVDMMRQNIRRDFPEAPPEEVDRRLQEWLFTRPGADLAVAVEDDGSAERFVRGLLQGGWRILAQVEPTSTHRLATIRAVPPGVEGSARVVVDFLFASSGIEPEVTRNKDLQGELDRLVAG